MWRGRLNAVIAKATGYELKRAGRDRTPAPPAGRPARSTHQPAPEAMSPAPSHPQPPHIGRRPRGNLPGHYDAAAKTIIRTVKPRTAAPHEKLYGLILATRYIAAHQIPGDIVGCGVWRGGSMKVVALTLLESGTTDRDLHLFDTFEGAPDTPDDPEPYTPLDDVRAAMDETEYPVERIHYHKGRLRDTVPALAPERISLLRLDTDWYESTRHELEHLYDRLSPGGVLIIDDFGGWEGSRRATEEFLEKTGAPLLLLPLKTGRIAVKPGW